MFKSLVLHKENSIDWDKTVNEQYAYKSNDSYIYINNYTESKNSDLLNKIVKST